MLVPVIRYEDHPVVELIYKGQFSNGGSPIFHCPKCDKGYTTWKLDMFYSDVFCCDECHQWVMVPKDLSQQVFYYEREENDKDN